MSYKQCNFCNEEYQAKRSDQKYCGTRCKNKASIQRRVKREVDLTNNFVDSPGGSITLSQNQFAELLKRSSGRTKSNVGSHDSTLLAEKDFNRDLSMQLTEFKMKLYYLEDKLKDKDNEILALKDDLKIFEDITDGLEKKKKYKKDGFWSTFGETCATDPEAAEKMMEVMERSVANFTSMVAVMTSKANSKLPQSRILDVPVSVGNNNVNQSEDSIKESKDENLSPIEIEIQKTVHSSLRKLENVADGDKQKFNKMLKKLEKGIDNPMILKVLVGE